jgi:ABC-2 type transport system permease protein
VSFQRNPMIWKELRQRLRERKAWLLPTIYLLLLSSAMLFMYSEMVNSRGNRAGPQGADLGTAVFFLVVFGQMVVLLLLAPVFSAGSITIEKEQRTLAALLTSLLTAPQIWWGKFVTALLYLILLLSSSLPLLALSFAFGGVEPKEVVAATGYSILVLASICALGLYCSALFKRSVHSTSAGYGLVLVLSVLTAVVFGYLQEHWVSSGAMTRGETIPAYIQAPLMLNPLYPLLALASNRESATFPYTLSSCLLFTAMLLLAAAFTMRRLKRSGEQI